MNKIDLDEIIRKNPRLDREALDALRKYLNEVAPSGKTRYRLAPFGTHRATIGMSDYTHPPPHIATVDRRRRYVPSKPAGISDTVR